MDNAIGEIRAGHYDLVFTIPIGNCEHRFREEKSLKQSLIASVQFPDRLWQIRRDCRLETLGDLTVRPAASDGDLDVFAHPAVSVTLAVTAQRSWLAE
jgi:hypothetical protein